jgi:hypothetical protein
MRLKISGASNINKDLVFYYPFDGSLGYALDLVDSSQGNIIGSVLQDQEGKINQGFYWDASYAYNYQVVKTKYTYLGNNGIYSFNFWCKCENITEEDTGAMYILGSARQSNTVGYIGFYRRYGNDLILEYATGISHPYATGIDIFSLNNEWEMITIVADYTNKVVKFYHNGELNNTYTTTNTMLYNELYDDFFIGSYRSTAYAACWRGYLDEFAAWNRLLTDAEVKTLYNSYTGLQYPFNVPKLKLNSYEQETLDLVDRMIVKPPDALKSSINNTIKELKNKDIWNKLDFLYFFNVHDASAALLNWIKPAHDASIINSTGTISFAPYIGFTGATSGTAYLNTNYNPYYDAVNYQIDSACAGVYEPFAEMSGTTYELNGAWSIFGSKTNRWQINFYNGYTPNQSTGVALNGAGHGIGTDISTGLISVNRANSTQITAYIDGSFKLTISDNTFETKVNNNIYLLALHTNTGGTNYIVRDTIGCAFTGGSLTEQQHLDFYNIMAQFNNDVSALTQQKIKKEINNLLINKRANLSIC